MYLSKHLFDLSNAYSGRLYTTYLVVIKESETVYLLAKELAYDVKNNRIPKLARGLEKVPGIDIVSFASALRKVDPHIDSLICNARTSDLNDRLGFCMRRGEMHIYSAKDLIGGINDSVNRELKILKSLWKSTTGGRVGFVKEDWEELVKAASVISGMSAEEKVKSPAKRWGEYGRMLVEGVSVGGGAVGLSQLYHNGSTAGYWPKSGYYKARNNAVTVAHNIVNSLSSAEKDALAELLVQRVEGGEVVEIKAISSTSVMINVCYDLVKK